MVSTRVTPNSDQVPVNIVGGNRYGRYSKISSEYTQNMFVSSNGYPANSEDYEQWLVSFAGYRRVLNLIQFPDVTPQLYPNQIPAGSGRGLFHSTRGDIAVAVVNSIVYKITPSLNSTQVGVLSSASGEVYMAENLNSQICLVDGVNCWIYNYSDDSFTLQDLNNDNLVPSYVEYHNTFFLFGNGLKNNFGSQWYAYISNSDTTITQVNPSNSALALQTKADYALAIKCIPGRGNNILVFGSTVCEIWTQVAGLQPYVRQPSVNINYGCASVATIASGGNYLAWLGQNEDEAPVIMVYDGNQAQRISTDGIDYLLSRVVSPESSTAFLYRQDGHLFYQLTFYDPVDNFTLLYDFNTQMFFNLTNEFGGYHPARQVIYFNLNVYFISLRNAAMYLLSSNITVIDENLERSNSGAPYNDALVYLIPRKRITGSIRQASSTRFRVNSFVLTLEQGNDINFLEADLQRIIGNAVITEHFNNPADDDVLTEGGDIVVTEQAFNTINHIISPVINALIPSLVTGIIYKPRIDLSLSKDSVTWSNKVSRTLHPYGKRQNILHWENMGVANDLTIKLEFYSLSSFVVSNGLLDVVS